MLVCPPGCTPVYRPHFELGDHVRRPPVSVVLITADGLAEPVMDELLAQGELPNIRRMIDRGARIPGAVCGAPALTYPVLATILTGCQPGRHGILGNKWFDRYSVIHRDYSTTRTYRDVDDDVLVPTVYEHLGDAFTVSIQCPIRRGVTRTIDNWATSGIRWFVEQYEATDQLMPWRFDIIAETANRRGEWPELIHVYFPALDKVGHRWGCDSARYRQALTNVDRQIGLVTEAIELANMSDRTCIVLVADHSHIPIDPANRFDVVEWLESGAGLRVRTTPMTARGLVDRERQYADVDAIMLMNGDRVAQIHLRGPETWPEPPTAERLAAVLAPARGRLVEQPGIEAVAVRHPGADGRVVVELMTRTGRATIERDGHGEMTRYRYRETEGHALALEPPATALIGDAGGWYGARAWLAATADGRYPGVVSSLADMFASARAGDVVLFAAKGWDFGRKNLGGHGGLGAADTRVPMIFSGSMIDPTADIHAAQLVDVTPTVLGLLGQRRVSWDFDFDGEDWSLVLTGRAMSAGVSGR
jgi:arylsulfatase A-like enzyme